VIELIQQHLESIYGIRCAHRASAFLIDADAALALGGTGRAREELLVLEEGDGLELALFVDPQVLQALGRHGERQREALEEDLPSYLEAAEGVSHFLYLNHTVEAQRTVSMLELEAQAEVDKFAVCALLRWNSPAAAAKGLISRLFERVGYHAALGPAERWRYQEANRLAKGYCRRLLPLVLERRLERFLRELRHAYRLGAEAKLRYLGA
jgi:hypothetical protein